MDTPKSKTYKVPADLMVEFADLIAEHELPCEVMGVSKKDKIILEVTYTTEEKAFVYQLNDLIDDYTQQEEKED